MRKTGPKTDTLMEILLICAAKGALSGLPAGPGRTLVRE
jgi:hypothetical protein